MMRALKTPRELVADTAYAEAVEQALFFAEQGMTPSQAIEAVGMTWGTQQPDWDDAIYALAYSIRKARRSGANGTRRKRPRHTGIVAPTGAKPTTIRACMTCGDPFESEGYGNRLCPACRKADTAAPGWEFMEAGL